MSDDDYPSDEDLLQIEQWECAWDASGKHPYFAPFFELLKSHWWMPDWGWREYDGSDDGDPVHVYHISTGGWSGNESLLGAMQRNFIVWSLTFNTHRRGGHYEFWIPIQPAAALAPKDEREK